MELLIVYVITLIVFSIIHKIGKNKKPVRKSIISLSTGFMCLIVVNILSVFTNVYIPFSILSILVSTIGGIPGVTMLLTLNLLI